jgi:hypothetical protein
VNVTGDLKALTPPDFALLQGQVALNQVMYEWSGLPEFNTYTLVCGSAQTDVADNDVAIYVNGTTGLDSNPGTLAQPVQTLDKGFNLLPPAWRKTCAMYVAAGTYLAPNQKSERAIGSPLNNGSPFVMVGETVDAGIAAGGPALGTLTLVAGTLGPVWRANVTTTPGAFRGAFIKHLPTGLRMTVVDNTTFAPGVTDFTLNFNPFFPGTAPLGTTFVVERPATIIQVPVFDPTGAPFAFRLTTDGDFLGFVNLKFESATVPPVPNIFMVTIPKHCPSRPSRWISVRWGARSARATSWSSLHPSRSRGETRTPDRTHRLRRTGLVRASTSTPPTWEEASSTPGRSATSQGSSSQTGSSSTARSTRSTRSMASAPA